MEHPASLPRVLLFDLDGTLTDNFAGISRSIVHALELLGVAPPPHDVLRACVGPPLRGSFARFLGTDESAPIERALAHYRARYADIGWRENTIYDGMTEAVGTLSGAGTVLHVCTSKPQPYAERIIAHFGLAPHFARVYGADLAGTLDDKARLIERLLAHEHLNPDNCVMIGDREHDVRAAHANGMRAAGVLWGFGGQKELELAMADVIVATPGTLVAALTQLARPALP